MAVQLVHRYLAESRQPPDTRGVTAQLSLSSPRPLTSDAVVPSR
jgi:hypothetical protein